jgi:hypothetical protein
VTRIMGTLTHERTTRTDDARYLIAVAFACGFVGGCGNGDRWAGDRIVEDFAAHTYDRWTFRTQGAPRGPAWGRWDLTGDGLRAVRPRGELDRPPLELQGRFDLEGDFEVMACFAIVKLPRPKTKDGSNRIAIFLDGPDRSASLYRAANSGADGYGYEIHGAQADSEKRFVPTRATTGRLRVERRGSTMTFSRSEAAGPLEQIGSAEFDSGPISEIAFLADALNSDDGLDVRFDRIEILADRIKRRGPSSGESTPWGALIIGLLAAGAFTALIILLWRSYR